MPKISNITKISCPYLSVNGHHLLSNTWHNANSTLCNTLLILEDLVLAECPKLHNKTEIIHSQDIGTQFRCKESRQEKIRVIWIIHRDSTSPS